MEVLLHYFFALFHFRGATVVPKMRTSWFSKYHNEHTYIGRLFGIFLDISDRNGLEWTAIHDDGPKRTAMSDSWLCTAVMDLVWR